MLMCLCEVNVSTTHAQKVAVSSGLYLVFDSLEPSCRAEQCSCPG